MRFRFWRVLPLLTLILTAVVPVAADEAGRRAFMDPDDRAHKFQTPDQIFPVRRATAGKRALALPKAKLPRNFSIDYEFDGETYSTDDFYERTNTSALLVLKNGKIVLETYRNGSGPKTRFISFSTGKSFVSTLVGMAVEDGFIDSINDPLTKYIPALTGSAYDGVSIRDALQMSSGVEWDESGYSTENTTYPLTVHFEQSVVQQRYRFIEAANTLKRAHEPGTYYNYSTLESSVLGWLVENATKQPVTDYLEQRLWQPAGMEFDAAWILDGPEAIGRELGGGGLAVTLRDYGRFGLMMANGGQINGKQLISRDWVKAATSPDRDQIQYGNLYEGYPLGYGYQWWLFPSGRFEAQGVFGQFVYVAPEEDVVIVKLSHWPEAWVDEMERESYAFFEAVVSAVASIQ